MQYRIAKKEIHAHTDRETDRKDDRQAGMQIEEQGNRQAD
jgi:hypothetical protein